MYDAQMAHAYGYEHNKNIANRIKNEWMDIIISI